MPTATEGRRAARRSGAVASRSKPTKTTTKRRLLVEPDTDGPRVRLGILWFFLVLAAVTSGRIWISLLCGLVSCVAGYQATSAWVRPSGAAKKTASGAGRTPSGKSQPARKRTGQGGSTRAGSRKSRKAPKSYPVLAALIAGALPLLAGYSTGAVGAGFVVTPLFIIVFHTVARGNFVAAVPTLIGALVPAVAAVSIVLTVRLDLWAGLFLVLAVSLYDAGSFLLGAEAASRWEGPVAGVIGALAVTFTMGVFHPNPFDAMSVAISGAVLALACPLGQIAASAYLPRPDTKAPALRRLDAYLVAGPAFYACAAVIAG